jgi:hypothetical protein
MAKMQSSVQFKRYQPEQILLLPPLLSELIDDHHLVGEAKQCRVPFKQIDELNTAEDRQYVNADLEERGLSAKEITAETMNEQADKLDNIIETYISKKGNRGF